MFDKLKQWLDRSRELGITFWYAYDPVSKKPSITLFMAYVSFMLAVISLISLHFKATLLAATGMAFIFNCMMIVFYLIRSLNKAKVDLDNKSIELESGEKIEK